MDMSKNKPKTNKTTSQNDNQTDKIIIKVHYEINRNRQQVKDRITQITN